MVRPRSVKTLDEFQRLIDSYFTSLGKGEKAKMPTLSGLALHCGYAETKAFKDQASRSNLFEQAVKKALSRVSDQVEQLMLAGKNPAGPIFWLKNQGWSDTRHLTIEGNISVLDRIAAGKKRAGKRSK